MAQWHTGILWPHDIDDDNQLRFIQGSDVSVCDPWFKTLNQGAWLAGPQWPRAPLARPSPCQPLEVFLTGTARTRKCFGGSDPARNRDSRLYNGPPALCPVRWPVPCTVQQQRRQANLKSF